MAAVHFTTIPCEPYTVQKVEGKPYFCSICPCAQYIVHARFEDIRTFLAFMSVGNIFVRYELRVNVPVAIFFPTKD